MTAALRFGTALEDHDFASLRRDAMLRGFKWDSQVGDACTLSPRPLFITRREWSELERLAEALAAETLAAEEELLARPDLLARLGMPRALRRALPGSADGPRVMRFDFHPTPDGWRVSEVNADVPGGFFEADVVTNAVALKTRAQPSGAPGERWADALATGAAPGDLAVLLCAPGFVEDAQVVAYLAALLRTRGLRTQLTQPEDFVRGRLAERASIVVRFFQAEWLGRLAGELGRVRMGNPLRAACVESKRFPLTWSELSVKLATWRALLPQCVDPRAADWSGDWIFKAAFANNGDEVVFPDRLTMRQRRSLRLDIAMRPGRWIAQRRFEGLRFDDELTPCVGVHVVQGKAAGAYVRATTGSLVDFAAMDVPLLVEDRA